MNYNSSKKYFSEIKAVFHSFVMLRDGSLITCRGRDGRHSHIFNGIFVPLSDICNESSLALRYMINKIKIDVFPRWKYVSSKLQL